MTEKKSKNHHKDNFMEKNKKEVKINADTQKIDQLYIIYIKIENNIIKIKRNNGLSSHFFDEVLKNISILLKLGLDNKNLISNNVEKINENMLLFEKLDSTFQILKVSQIYNYLLSEYILYEKQDMYNNWYLKNDIFKLNYLQVKVIELWSSLIKLIPNLPIKILKINSKIRLQSIRFLLRSFTYHAIEPFLQPDSKVIYINFLSLEFSPREIKNKKFLDYLEKNQSKNRSIFYFFSTRYNYFFRLIFLYKSSVHKKANNTNNIVLSVNKNNKINKIAFKKLDLRKIFDYDDYAVFTKILMGSRIRLISYFHIILSYLKLFHERKINIYDQKISLRDSIKRYQKILKKFIKLLNKEYNKVYSMKMNTLKRKKLTAYEQKKVLRDVLQDENIKNITKEFEDIFFIIRIIEEKYFGL